MKRTNYLYFSNFTFIFFMFVFLVFNFISCDAGPVEGKLVEKTHIAPYTETVDDYMLIMIGDMLASVPNGSHEVYHEAKFYFTIETEEGKIKKRQVSKMLFDRVSLEEHVKLDHKNATRY